MKGILIFLLLLSFVVNSNPKCKPNKGFDEQTQKCEKLYEIGEIFILETSSCELNSTNLTCPKGLKFNTETSSCEPEESISPPDPVIPVPDHVIPKDIYIIPGPGKNDPNQKGNCKGGVLKMEYAIAFKVKI